MSNNTTLSAKLELSSKQYRAGDGQDLRVIITNNSNQTVNLLKWQLPIEGMWDCDPFWVKRGEEVQVYLGKVMKRAAPKPYDYVTLDPQESIQTDFDLSEAYDISKAGKYTIELDSRALDVGTQEPKVLAKRLAETREFHPQRLRSNIVDFELLEDRAPKQLKGVDAKWSALLTTTPKIPEFRSCTTSQQNELNEAKEAAELIAKQALDVLVSTEQSARAQARRYKEWFGNYTQQAYDQVTNNYSKIVDALATKQVIFNCSMEDCREGVFAYVYPSRPYEIFLCGAFWSAELTGTDSRAGTIVHELSHFNVVAGTDDNVYGQRNCRQLAIDSPEEAIANADSHEYFSENTPEVPM
jgi:peptidyl-Lys metalloendopeptidase